MSSSDKRSVDPRFSSLLSSSCLTRGSSIACVEILGSSPEDDKKRSVIIRVKHECKLSDKRSTDKRMHRLSDTYYAILGRRRGSRYARLDPRVKREEDKRRNVILGQAQLRSNEMDSLLLNGI